MKKTNTPAFPTHGLPGMTLRDYFAAQAMQGELASQAGGDYEWRNHEKLARHCYSIADAMLEARDE